MKLESQHTSKQFELKEDKEDYEKPALSTQDSQVEPDAKLKNSKVSGGDIDDKKDPLLSTFAVSNKIEQHQGNTIALGTN